MADITYQMVLGTLQTVGLLVGIVYYITIMRNTQRTREVSLKAQEEAERNRQRDMIIQRSQSFSLEYTKTFLEVRAMIDWDTPEEFFNKYGPETNPEARSKWIYIMRLYEMAGLHLKEGADPEILFEIWPVVAILNLWEQFESVIEYQRQRINAPHMYEPFEHLYSMAKKEYPNVVQKPLITNGTSFLHQFKLSVALLPNFR